jgi:AraC-like DNA-binding protein
MLGAAPSWYPFVNALVLAAICVSGAFVFLDAREDLFGVRAPAQPALAPLPVAANAPGPEIPPPAPAADRTTLAELCRLEKLISVDEVWREEGLTVAGLALRVGVPETQLRRLINDHLGFRNFPSFINARRIACAKGRLADPDEARISISTIAFEIGFASLGPFNRAFREAVGKAPSEWRREALAAAPAPEPAARAPRVAAE